MVLAMTVVQTPKFSAFHGVLLQPGDRVLIMFRSLFGCDNEKLGLDPLSEFIVLKTTDSPDSAAACTS